MWKMMLLAAGVLSTLSLPVDGATSLSAPCLPPVQRVDGKLTFEDGRGAQIPEWEPWIGPGVETPDDWFGLDFKGNKELAARAAEWCGKQVRVTGRVERRTLSGLIPHQIRVLVVSDLQLLDTVKKPVTVELKGQFVFRADRLDILRPDARLSVDGKTYIVDLGNNRTLWQHAACLDGHPAVVTGTLQGDTIRADALRPDKESFGKP
jgi:hypothetical protein